MIDLFGFEWARPWYALVLLAAPLAAWWMTRGAGTLRFSSLAAVPRRGSLRTHLAWLPPALVAVGVAALALAMASPRRGDDHARIRRDGIAIMMSVDISSSMRALDLSPAGVEATRLDAVKEVFAKFVGGGGELAGRADDAIGLVTFAGYADTRSPLTLDHANLLRALADTRLVEDRREDGTALGDGLALAVERLRQFPAPSKVIMLLTDGVETAGTLAARAAADLAKEHGIKVYTIGAGTDGMARVRVDDRLMQVPVEIDEETLTYVADTTGGRYFRATDATSLRDIYDAIDKLERTELTGERFLDYRQYFAWFAAIGLGLIVLALILRGTVLRRLP